MARGGNALAIKAHERLTSLDMIALGNEQLKAPPMHLNGVDAYMHEKLDTAIAADAHGMRHGGTRHTRSRRADNALVGPNGAALPQHSRREHGVRHIAQSRNPPRGWRVQHDNVLLFTLRIHELPNQ